MQSQARNSSRPFLLSPDESIYVETSLRVAGNFFVLSRRRNYWSAQFLKYRGIERTNESTQTFFKDVQSVTQQMHVSFDGK